jgi:hypothetical protein
MTIMQGLDSFPCRNNHREIADHLKRSTDDAHHNPHDRYQ